MSNVTVYVKPDLSSFLLAFGALALSVFIVVLVVRSLLAYVKSHK